MKCILKNEFYKVTKDDHINYWKVEAEESWKSALLLLNGKQYLMSLFCFHLCVEKLLKAIWVKDNIENYPPRTHNLIVIYEQTKLKLSEDQILFLKVIDAWNIEGRYPDYKNKLFKTANKKYVESVLKVIKDLKKCLLKKMR